MLVASKFPYSCPVPFCRASSCSSSRRVCKPESHSLDFICTGNLTCSTRDALCVSLCWSCIGWGFSLIRMITIKAKRAESCCRTEIKSLQECWLSALHKIFVAKSCRQKDQSTRGSPHRPEQLQEVFPSASADISLGFWKSGWVNTMCFWEIPPCKPSA